jgi:hypothetical protein
MTAATAACPKCQSTNTITARFCLTCGAPLQNVPGNGAFQYAPPAPSFPPPQTNSTGFLGGASPTDTTLGMSVQSAYNASLVAIQSAGGTVKSQQAPYLIRFEIVKKSFWGTGGMRMRYDGEIALSPAGSRQTAVRITLKLQSSSKNTILGMYAATGLVLMLFWAGFGFVVGAVGTVIAWHKYGTRMPNDIAEALSTAMAQPVSSGYASPAPVMPQQQTIDRTVATNRGGSVVDRLKELTQLRDLGVVTAEEFEAKKAELLRRI